MSESLSKPLKALLEKYRERATAQVPDDLVNEILELTGKNPSAALELGPQAHVLLRARIRLLATRDVVRIGKTPDKEESELTHKLLVRSIRNYYATK